MPERSEIDNDAIGRMVGQAREVLAGLSGRSPAGGEPEGQEEIRATGTTDDGHVQVVIDHTGMVEEVTVDRHARGLGTEELGAQVVVAYTRAHEDFQQQMRDQVQSGAVADPYEMNEKLLEMQESSLRQGMALIDSFGSMTSKVERAAGD